MQTGTLQGLMKPFTAQEICEAICGFKNNKSPGPDGISNQLNFTKKNSHCKVPARLIPKYNKDIIIYFSLLFWF